MEGTKRMPPQIEATLACLSILCLGAYWFPATAILGAILFTGYMGGAILAHLRVGDPLVLQIVIPVLLWLGVWLRDPRVRALFPFARWRQPAD
jgi:DoxX-like family